MIVFYSPDHKQHVPKFQYFGGKLQAHPESPARIDSLLNACGQLGLEIRALDTKAPIESLCTVHNRAYIDYLYSACVDIPLGKEVLKSRYAQDTYTPLNQHTYEAANRSANVAICAAKALLSGGSNAYALCRPPGHHALPKAMGGFCYFNNAALAADMLSRHGKVAILDIDYHHGNGTQHIFYERNDVLYVSLHADPSFEFPHNSGYSDEQGVGIGEGFTHNYPLPKNTNVQKYLQTLKTALIKIQVYDPNFVVLSLGFDTYKHDPIAGFDLDENSFYTIGRLLATNIKYPLLIVQEGGYNVDKLGVLAQHFLRGYVSPAGRDLQ